MTVELTLPEIIVGALALTSLGQRALKWAWAHRELVRETFNALEDLYANGAPETRIVVKAVKRNLERITEDEGGTKRRIAAAAAAYAESMNGAGSTTRRLQDRTRRQKAGDVVKGIARWLPVVGALLD